MKLSVKFLMGIIWGLSALPLTAADKILENGDFSKVNQLDFPIDWTPVNNSVGSVFIKKENNTNYVELKNEAGNSVFLVQHDLDLLPNKKYDITYKVKSEAEAEYRVYMEWTDYSKKSDEPQRLKAIVHNSNWQKAPKNWETKTFEITCPDEKYSKPYLVLNAKGKEVSFSSIDIVEAKEKPQAKTETKVPEKKPAIKAPVPFSNGDFENGIPTGLTMTNASIVSESNSKALSISGDKAKAVINWIKIEPGQRYKLSYMAKAGGKVLSSTGFQYFRVYVSWEGAEQKNGMEWLDTWPNNYQKKELVFTAPKIDFPKGMTITCELNDAGSLFIDNMSIEQLPPEKVPEVKITVTKPFYRNIIYSTDPVSEISGSLWISENVANADVKLLSLDSSKTFYQKKYSDVKENIGFNIPAEKLESGKYLLQVSVYGKDGKELDKTETQIWKLQKSPNEVIFKSDLNCYINGKIFYPVVFWRMQGINPGMTVEELRVVLYHATRNGVNTFLLSPGKTKDNLKILNVAKEFNAKMVLNVTNANSVNKDIFTKWKHDILNFLHPDIMGHEALLGYFLTDEPMWRGVPLENLTKSYDFIKEIDPSKPIWINEAPRGTVKDLGEYSAASDIWGVDIYPVPSPSSHSSLEDKGLTSVGKYTRIFCESVDFRKPVWMTLQGFSWHSFSKKPKVYPDMQQTRFTAFDCIVNGAQSIAFWGMTYIDDPKFFDVLFDTTKRLSELSGVITLPDAPAGTVKADNAAIKFLTKEKDGKVYIIAVNESDKDIEVKFSGKFNVSSVKVIFENREMKCADNSFSDKFKAYDVHIYASAEIPPATEKLPSLNEELEKKVPVFIKFATDKINALAYNGKAEWIWYPGKNKEAFSAAAFKKDFEITEIPAKAEIIITADDNYVLFVNGTKAGEDCGLAAGGWETAEKYNITKLLKNGTNTIYVEASDAGAPPCGFLADVVLKMKDNSEKHIVSDSTWQVNLIKEITKKTDENFKGVNAEKIEDYGKGPWANNVTVVSE